MTPADTDIKTEPTEAAAAEHETSTDAAAPEAAAPAETPSEPVADAPAEPEAAAPAETPAEPVADAPAEPEAAAPAETPAEPVADAPAEPEAAAPAEPAAEPAAPDAAVPPTEAPAADGEAAAAPAAAPTAPKPRASRQADRRKILEEQSRAQAAELGREPDRRIVEKAILAAGGPDAVREFMATPQESREGKPLGWRIACLREARRHDVGGKAETGWVTLSAVPVRQIRNALDRAVDADGRIMFRDEVPESARRGGGRGRGDGPRGGRGGRGGDERAVADQFMEGGVASFGGGDTAKRNPFAALSGLLEDDKSE